MDSIPTGNTSDIVQQYFNHLYSTYLSSSTQTYYIHWDVVLWVLFWIFMLIFLLYAYTRWQRTSQSEHEPYPVESYNGYIQESNGPIGTFLTIFFIVMFIWLATVTYMSLTHGQIY